jgi:solute:Na+ symporter, SSS family
MVSGAAAWFLWTAFVHAAEAKPLGLCQAIFGKASLLGLPWSVIDPIVIALPISFIVMIVMQVRAEKRQPAAVPAAETTFSSGPVR